MAIQTETVASTFVAAVRRLYADVPDVLPALWERLVQALALSPSESRHRSNRSWADEALNAPAGRLAASTGCRAPG